MVKGLVLSGCLSGAMIVFTIPSGAVTARECVPVIPNAWDAQHEANTIFRSVRSDAEQALDHASTLQSLTLSDETSWQSHAGQLHQLKAEVNDMGGKLCRLETMRRVVAPWQRETIERIAKTLRLMADNTEDAILFVNSNQDNLWNPAYQNYVNNLCDQAKSLARSADNAVEFSKVLKQYQGLRKDLKVRAS